VNQKDKGHIMPDILENENEKAAYEPTIISRYEGEDEAGVLHASSAIYLSRESGQGVETPENFEVVQQSPDLYEQARPVPQETAEAPETFEPVVQSPAQMDTLEAGKRLERMYTSLDRVGVEIPRVGEMLPYVREPDRESARAANAELIAQAYQKPVEEIKESYPLYRADYAAKMGMPLIKDEVAFYKTGQKVIKAREQAQEIITSMTRSAVEGAIGDDGREKGFAAWREQARKMPGWDEEHEGKFRAAYQATHKQVNEQLRPHRELVQRNVKAMRSRTGVEAHAAEYYHPEDELKQLAEHDPETYKLVLAAVKAASGKTVLEDKSGASGYVQRMGEGLGRAGAALVDNTVDFAGHVAARGAHVFGAEDHEKRIRAGLRVDRDLRDLEQGTIDPIKSYSEGFMKHVDMAVFGFLNSAPTMVAAMIPGMQPVLIANYSSESLEAFHDAGWEGADAEAAALFTGVFMFGVERASETLGRIPRVKEVLARHGFKPGVSGVAPFLAKSFGRGSIEFGEEFLQTMAAPVVQEVLAATFDSIPDLPEGRELKDELMRWTKSENLVPLALMVMPLGMLGTGLARRKDLPGIDSMTSDPRLLELYGFEPEVAGRIAHERDPIKRSELIQQYNDQRGTAEERLARSEQVAIQWQAQQYQQQQGKAPGDGDKQQGSTDEPSSDATNESSSAKAASPVLTDSELQAVTKAKRDAFASTLEPRLPAEWLGVVDALQRGEKVSYPGIAIRPKQGLDRASRIVEAHFAHYIAANPQRALNRYFELARQDFDHGRYVGADLARSVLPEYDGNKEFRTLFHDATVEPAGYIAFGMALPKLYQEGRGKFKHVMFTAGGYSSGKTTVVHKVLSKEAQEAAVIIDSPISSVATGDRLIQDAIGAGYEPDVYFIYRPWELAYKGAVERMKREGRPVVASSAVRAHYESQRAFLYLAKKWSSKKALFTVVSNQGGLDDIHVEPLDFLEKNAYFKHDEEGARQRELETKYSTHLDAQYRAGHITGIEYSAAKGRGPGE